LIQRLLDPAQTGAVHPHGPERALSTLLEVSGSMTPEEFCEATVLLRSAGQETLTCSLVTAFARQREEGDVILAALALQCAREDGSLSLLLSTAAHRQR
jgi:hypothetical protein